MINKPYIFAVVVLVCIVIGIQLHYYFKDIYFEQGAFWMWSTIEKNHYYPAPFEITYRATLLEYRKATEWIPETADLFCEDFEVANSDSGWADEAP